MSTSEAQSTCKESCRDTASHDQEPAVVQSISSSNTCATDAINGANGSSKTSSNHSLRVDENWFNDDAKKKKNSGLLKKFSPKLHKKITPKSNGSYSVNRIVRKCSESSSDSSQSSVSNADSGIVLNNGQSPSSASTVTETNSRLPSNVQNCVSGSVTPTAGSPLTGFTFNGFAVAIHRKMVRILSILKGYKNLKYNRGFQWWSS